MKPLCIDLFCGLGGWSEAFFAEGYHCRASTLRPTITAQAAIPAN